MPSGTGPLQRRQRGGAHAARHAVATRDVVGSVVLATVLAVSQPILDLLGRNPEFFANRQAPPGDIVVLAVLLAVVLPAVLALVVALLVRVQRTAGLVLHGVVLGALMLSLVHQVTDGMPLPAAVKALLGVLAAVAAVVVFHRVAALRTVLRWGIAVPLLALAMFVGVSPVARLVVPAYATESAERGAAQRPPVVVVLLDALPVAALMESDGTIDEALYPNFARLAEQSTWFRNTTTPHSWTSEVTPALLTGRERDPERAPTATDYPENLFTLMDDLGYDVHAEETVSWLCPPATCPPVERAGFGERFAAMLDDVRVVALHVLLPDPFATGLPPIDEGWGDFAAMAGDEQEMHLPDVTFDDWLATFESGGEDFFYYHMWQPHYPYERLPEGYAYTDPRDTPGGPGHGEKRWHRDDWFLAQAYSRMMLQVGYADRQIGLLLDALERSGLDREALLVVLSDHGVAFTPGSLLRHATADNLLEIAHVPLFIREPGQDEGQVDDRPVSLLDVVPTIADLLGVDDLWDVSGRSVLGDIPQDRTRSLESSERFEVPADARGIEAALQRKTEWFGTDDGWQRLFAFGPYGDLVGGAPEPLGEPTTTRAELDDADAYDHVDLDGEWLPALLTGRLSGLTGPDPVHLAVAVNGEVVATAKSFEHTGDGARFVAMLPAAAFRDGANDVALYLIAEREGTPELRPVPTR